MLMCVIGRVHANITSITCHHVVRFVGCLYVPDMSAPNLDFFI